MDKLSRYTKVLNPILPRLQTQSKSIFIAGHGRSGTTWIGNTFKKAPGILYYGEPCNPKVVKDGNFSHWFKYTPPEENDTYFESCLTPAFKGLITSGSTWLLQPYRRFLPGSRVLIKEVASLLLLEWVYKRYRPEVLFVLRHPCGVALSERNKKTSTDRPINELLKQSSLVENHLKPYVELMRRAKKPFEIYGAVWGARNRVIMDSIGNYPEWKILLYEDLCENPTKIFRELFDHFNLTWTDKVQKYIGQTTTEEKPGTYSTNRITKNQADKWKSRMTPEEIDQVRIFSEPFNIPYYNLESDWF